MTSKKGFLLGAVGVSCLWAGAAFVQLPRLEQELEERAATMLADPAHTEAFNEVSVSFSGQEAKLTGKVATSEDRRSAGDLISEELRLESGLGSGLNPVIDVENLIEVDGSLVRLHPKPWVVAYRLPKDNVVGGTLKDSQAANSVAAALAEANPISEWNVDGVRLVEGARPPSDWLGTLAKAPALVSADKEGESVAVSAGDGQWTLFRASATDDEIAAPLADIGVSRLELAAEMVELRQWQNPPPPPAPVVKEEPAPAPAPAVPAEPMPMKADSAPPVVELAKGVPTVGWAFADQRLDLFGRVGSADEKQGWVRAAHATFTGVEINVDGLSVDSEVATAKVDPVTLLRTPTASEGSAESGYVALWSPASDGAMFFERGVYDSELAVAVPAAELTPQDIGSALVPFRSRLLKAGRLELEQPYVSLISDGATITLVGEVADEKTKEAIHAQSVSNYEADFTVQDQIEVSPLVESVTDWAAGWKALPKFEKGKAGMAAVRPGQSWREAVVHAIYFKTGSDRSKDQERALYQVRRVLAASPAAKFEIVGHTDNTGTADANTTLSLERAENFAGYLRAAGVAQDRLSARGAGPDEPIADNSTDAGRAQNRRVDVLLK